MDDESQQKNVRGKKIMVWKSIDLNVWSPQGDKDFIEGTVLGRNEEEGTMIYHLHTTSGKIYVVHGNKHLNSLMYYAPDGTHVRIRSSGVKLVNGLPIRVFSVEVKEDGKEKTELPTKYGNE